MLVTWNLADGPTGLFDSHMNKSFCFLCSKNMQLLHDFSKHISSTTSPTSLRFTLDSNLVLGIISVRSLTRCLIRPAIPLEQRTSVLCRFFHSLEAGSGSLNALKSSSESTSSTYSSLFSSSYCESLPSACAFCPASFSWLAGTTLEPSSSLLSIACDVEFYFCWSFFKSDAILISSEII